MAPTKRLKVLRIFISSPGDLLDERAAVRDLIARLNSEYRERGLELEALLWEASMPRVLGYPPQEVVNYYVGRASETDIFIGMFWSRLGSEAVVDRERHPSGTVYELRDAYRRWRRDDRPLLMLCRCRRPPPADADPAQTRALDDFFRVALPRDMPELGGLLHEFQEAGELVTQLEISLRAIANLALANDDGRPLAVSVPVATSELRRLLDGIEAFLDSYDESQVQGKDGIEGLALRWRELHDDGTSTPLPGHSLLQHFDDRGSRLLLVGSEGRGKTFAMRRLMRDLADRARRRGSGLVPVYFNLASWSETHGSASGLWSWRSLWGGESQNETLDGWLIDELVRRYGMSRSSARRLVENRRIIICLDGLDELRCQNEDFELDLGHEIDQASAAANDAATDALRAQCVRQINRTLADESVAMVVCCRDETYRKFSVRPALGAPLEVEPLTSEQAHEFLRRFPDLDGLRNAIAQSPALQERIRTPLFLEYLCVAYVHLSAPTILAAAAKPAADWERHLLDHYVSARLAIANQENHSKAAINRCLTWMARREEPDFLIEDLQPDAVEACPSAAFPPRRARRLYAVLSAVWLASILGLSTAIPGALSNCIEWTATDSFATGVRESLKLGALSFFTVLFTTFPAFRTSRWWVFGGVLGTIFALVRFYILWWTPPQGLIRSWEEAAHGGLVTWPCAVFVFSLFGYQTLGRIRRHRRRYMEKPGIECFEIQPLESFDWHWIDPHEWWRGGWVGLLAGPLVGLAFYVPFGPARGAVFGILATAFVALFAGLSGTGLRVSYQPNQSIIRSARHAMLMGALFALVGAIACATAYGSSYGAVQALVNGALGLATSFTFLAFGGIPLIRHICLGQVLAWQGNLPSWRCLPPWQRTIRFLDDLVRFKLLRRSAGGYVFRHDSLRNHFRKSSS